MGAMLVHDMRLTGGTPANLAENNYEVDGTVPVQHAFDWIYSYAQTQGGLDNLYVLCHGYEADWNLSDQTCTGFQVGGFGLAMCAEGITLSNATIANTIKGDVKTITLFACATADTGPRQRRHRSRRDAICGELAMYTGATVIAATQTQFYVVDRTFWQRIAGKQGQIDFGDWEGPVYSFSPVDGTATQICLPAPASN